MRSILCLSSCVYLQWTCRVSAAVIWGAAIVVRGLAPSGRALLSEHTWVAAAVEMAAIGIALSPLWPLAMWFGIMVGVAGIMWESLTDVPCGCLGGTGAWVHLMVAGILGMVCCGALGLRHASQLKAKG
jgi:hypothetical protein